MTGFVRFSVSVPQILLKRLDDHRGMIARSRLVAKAIKELLDREESND